MNNYEQKHSIMLYWNSCKQNPWSIYNILTLNDVLEELDLNGFNSAYDLIRKKDAEAFLEYDRVEMRGNGRE